MVKPEQLTPEDAGAPTQTHLEVRKSVWNKGKINHYTTDNCTTLTMLA